MDELVPEALVDSLCDGNCIVTRSYSLIEPEPFARRYLAPGIGVFLEVEPADEVVVQLSGCNFDPRCAVLPARAVFADGFESGDFSSWSASTP